MHDDRIEIDARTVAGLVADQFPTLREFPIKPVEGPGTVNAIFRIGEHIAARFPLRAGDPDEVGQQLRQEQVAAASFADAVTPLSAPRPIGVGDPGYGYPLPWALQSWLSGSDATTQEPAAVAHALATTILALRRIPTGGRTHEGTGRGGDLRAHDERIEEYLAGANDLIDVERASRFWEDVRKLPRMQPESMTHGDLIPGNVLVSEGRLVGLLDTGGFGAADPALDSIAAWHLFDDDSRAVFRSVLGCSDLEWQRSRAWAFEQALGAASYYRDTNEAMFVMGITTLERVLPANVRGG